MYIRVSMLRECAPDPDTMVMFMDRPGGDEAWGRKGEASVGERYTRLSLGRSDTRSLHNSHHHSVSKYHVITLE